MYFRCGKCRYTFENPEKPERCPDCGSKTVQEADVSEIEEYLNFRKEFEQ